jgi:hypothetical protein
MNTKHTIDVAPTRPWRTKSGVVVGALYNRCPPIHHDRDALRLQLALLGGKEGPRLGRLDWDGILIAGACVMLALAVLVPFWMGK